MDKIGIFFGTDSGTTRLMAKKMSRILGDIASKPLNVNRISVDDMLQYDSLILGTPSYGIGDLPGKETGVKDGSWAEFIPQLENKDLSGKRIALYGLGDQDKYKDRFANSLFTLYDFLVKRGAEIIGQWPVDGYEFEDSNSVIDGRFIGLVIDQLNQGLLSDDRIKNWLELITPALVEHISTKQEQIA